MAAEYYHGIPASSPTHELPAPFTPGFQSTPYTPGANDDVAESIPRDSTGTRSQEVPLHDPAETGGFFSRFERPDYSNLVLHIFLCFLAFPLVYLIPNKSTENGLPIFWTRTIVAVVCGIVGAILSLSLLSLGQRSIEAAMWSTIIYDKDITLAQFSALTENPRAPLSAAKLAWLRLSRLNNQEYRRTVKFTWIVAVLMYLALAIVSYLVVFTLGRIVTVHEFVRRQSTDWISSSVPGDLSAADIASAQPWIAAATDSAHFWTFVPSTMSQYIPQPVSFAYPSTSSAPTDQVFFAEVQPTLLHGVPGLGTFNLSTSSNSTEHLGTQVLDVSDTVVTTPNDGLIRWPRWGLQTACESLPNFGTNFIQQAASGNTYAFVPHSVLSDLFNTLRTYTPPTLINNSVNITAFMRAGDAAPSGLDASTIALAGAFPNNGQPLSFSSTILQPSSLPEDYNGWVNIDILLVRLNTSFVPSGAFAGGKSATGIGYDAAVCVELFTPWVAETYNGTAATSVPRTNGIVSPGGMVIGAGQRDSDKALINGGVRQGLSASGKENVFTGMQANARNLLLKDRDPSTNYYPSPTVLSLSDGAFGGPSSYTQLSAPHVAQALAVSDATNLLPFLVGSQPIIAHTYRNTDLASAYAHALPLAIALLIFALMGLPPTFLVPRLPYARPRRDFSLFSWLAVMEDDELLGRVRRMGRLEELGIGAGAGAVDLESMRKTLGKYPVKMREKDF
ncbi:hypothetical protein BOTBODRAFT_34491 [Botryobasidium botryosum FD-172 SS1]|uniref:Uncharacterized protein n=1 Tax=Botryobasidium botryosum (strain FD-172 SS1) TaxID=930990 RepID=A0A067MCT6_BOTB1|nr:hypothetical protein BOTBODRAFT_34491 [Botryobasidium botryosum FD-172 SS1]